MAEKRFCVIIAVVERPFLEELPFDDYFSITIPKKSDQPMATMDDVKVILGAKLDELIEGMKL